MNQKDEIELKPMLVPLKWMKSRYIVYFSKTPEDIVCPHFFELKWANGCPFGCSYCYLQGTFFGNKSPRIKNVEGLRNELEDFLTWADSKSLKVMLNTGELSDSLAIIEWTRILLDVISESISRHPGHKFLFVTKGGVKHIGPLFEWKGDKRSLVVSFSLNASLPAKLYERGTPPPEERMKAAKLVQEAGFELRLRLDPMIPVPGWREEYSSLVSEIFEGYELNPTRITLGTLRGLWKTIKYAKDRKWVDYLRGGEKTGWGLKMNAELRKDMYQHVLKEIRAHDFKGDLALCKETLNLWMQMEKLELLYNPGKAPDWKGVRCNCIP